MSINNLLMRVLIKHWNKKYESPHSIQNFAPKCSFPSSIHPPSFLKLKKIVEMRRNCNLWMLPEESERKMRTFRYRSALKKENISIIFYYFQHERFWDFNHEFLLLTEIKITLKKMRVETFPLTLVLSIMLWLTVAFKPTKMWIKIKFYFQKWRLQNGSMQCWIFQ